ncbi:hypothetical protein [Stutzerimonas nitrititolerans]|uniref:hypothetical protein n=1 Tax=Stutzerimonas nitrititolerans TaxID=2482751 RepID=UPI0028ADE671|nr:hypothetical protein [Stutzerimonas nitrititolerans]
MLYLSVQKTGNYILKRPAESADKCFAAIFMIILFSQNPPWPMWELQTQILAFFVMVGLLLTIAKCGSFFYGGVSGLFIIAIGFLYFFIAHGFLGTIRVSSAVFVATLFMLLQLNARVGELAFDWMTYMFSFLSMLSLFFWVLWQVGVPLSSSELYYGVWKGENISTFLDNYYFFVTEGGTSVKRFYGVFDEPGVVGTLSALMLCGLRFNFSLKRTWIILVAGALSWSLAFVILSVVGFILVKRGGRAKLVFGLMSAGGGVVGLYLLSDISAGDSAYQLLLYRIANFSEYGVSSRVDDSLNSYFMSFLGSSYFLFGEGTSFFQKNPELLSGQGVVFYMIEYGFFGVLVLLSFYVLLIYRFSVKRIDGYLLLTIFLLSFLQRPHLMTPWQIVLFWSILCCWSQAEKYRALRCSSSN